MAENLGEYANPECCPVCNGKDYIFRIAQSKNDVYTLQFFCNECGHFYTLPKQENLRKRVNNQLDKWAEKIKHRDGKRCIICGSTDDLEAHHIIPVSHSEKFKYSLKNGITLCKSCHWLVHHKEEGVFNG